MNTADRILSGDVRAIAHLLRDVEDDIPSARRVLRDLYPHTGRAHIVGITGSPGVGKSTLLDHLIRAYRKEGLGVGVLAIDPTSPFTGGAVLGDRVRMQRHFLDGGVFIRSIATRGHTGGVTRSIGDMIDVLDAAGKNVIFIETVGVGQNETEIVNSAHTVVLVTVPGLGDDIQAMKAGIMEIGHIFVVNKADRDTNHETARHLRALLELGSKEHELAGWQPPVIETAAARTYGMEELRAAIRRHRELVFTSGRPREEISRRLARNRIVSALRELALAQVINRMENGGGSLDSLVARVLRGEADPYTLAQEAVREALAGRAS